MSVAALLALSLAATPPSLDAPAAKQSGGEKDVALVVGVSKYDHASPVPYADNDARAFAAYLMKVRGVPTDRVRTLLNDRAAKEDIEAGVEFVQKFAEPGGTAWVYFAGHGVPSPSGNDGLLAGVDVKATLASIERRSISRQWLSDELEQVKADRVVVLLDACFSGKTREGTQLVEGLRPLVAVKAAKAAAKVLVFSAASNDETSGPFDAARQGLFTYFAVGGLRGWADGDADGTVSAVELASYVRKGTATVLSDGSRSQTPNVNADPGDARLAWPLATGAREKGPDLAMFTPASSAGSNVSLGTTVTLNEVPALSGNLKEGGAITLDVDPDVLVAYDAAVKADETGKQDPDTAAERWTRVASYQANNPYQADAMARARQWKEFSTRKRSLGIQREADTQRLKKVLPLAAVSLAQKEQLLASYTKLYGSEPAAALIDVVEPADARGRLCSTHLKYASLGSGPTLKVEMPKVDGEALQGTVEVDGQSLGAAWRWPAAPTVYFVPTCASTVTVVEKGGGKWTAALSTLSANDGYVAHPTFEGILDDEARAKIPPPPSPSETPFFLTAAPTFYVSGTSSSAALGGSLRAAYMITEFIGLQGGLCEVGPFFGMRTGPVAPLQSGRFSWEPAAVVLNYGIGMDAFDTSGFYMMPSAETVLRLRFGPLGLRAFGGPQLRLNMTGSSSSSSSSGSVLAFGLFAGAGLELNL